MSEQTTAEIVYFLAQPIREVMLRDEIEYIDNLSDEIIRCFDEKDSDSLEALFCLNVQKKYELSLQIDEAFNLYEGKSQSYRITNRSSAGGYANGVAYDEHFTPLLRDIATDKNKTYCIGYLVYRVYDNDKGKEGIIALGLMDENKNEIARIGES